MYQSRTNIVETTEVCVDHKKEEGCEYRIKSYKEALREVITRQTEQWVECLHSNQTKSWESTKKRNVST